MTSGDSSLTQERRILLLLQAAWPNWVPAPELSKISLGYNRAIHTLRHKMGFRIANKVEVVDGGRHGFFRLGDGPIPSSRELRAQRDSLAGDVVNGVLFDMHRTPD